MRISFLFSCSHTDRKSSEAFLDARWRVFAVAVIGAVAPGAKRTSKSSPASNPHECAPRRMIDKNVVDFGAVPYRKMIEAKFGITNGGKEVLGLVNHKVGALGDDV